jgi:hypothetical protein
LAGGWLRVFRTIQGRSGGFFQARRARGGTLLAQEIEGALEIVGGTHEIPLVGLKNNPNRNRDRYRRSEAEMAQQIEKTWP